MALKGTLRDFGLADIFQLIGIQRKTGVLTLSNAELKVIVSFLSGSVVSADCTRPALEDRLGAVLVKSGKITEKQLGETLKTQKTTLQRLGRILIERKAITPEDLREALRVQVTQIVYNLFRWRDGAYDFSQEETIDYDREYFQPIPAENILMEGARMIDEWPIIERRIPDFKLILRRTEEAVPSESEPLSVYESDIDFGLVGEAKVPSEAEDDPQRLNADEIAVLRMVDGRSNVQDIIDRSQLGEFETCRILYEFLNRGLIRIGENAGVSHEASASAPRRSISLLVMLVLLPILAFLSLAASLESPLSPLGGRLAGDPFAVNRIRVHLSQARVGRIDRALHLFFLDKQSLPTSLDPLVAGGFLNARDLVDPWGRPYDFRIRSSGYTITGFGPNGLPDDSTSVESHFLGPERLAIEGGAADRNGIEPPAGAARPNGPKRRGLDSPRIGS